MTDDFPPPSPPAGARRSWSNVSRWKRWLVYWVAICIALGGVGAAIAEPNGTDTAEPSATTSPALIAGAPETTITPTPVTSAPAPIPTATEPVTVPVVAPPATEPATTDAGDHRARHHRADHSPADRASGHGARVAARPRRVGHDPRRAGAARRLRPRPVPLRRHRRRPRLPDPGARPDARFAHTGAGRCGRLRRRRRRLVLALRRAHVVGSGRARDRPRRRAEGGVGLGCVGMGRRPADGVRQRRRRRAVARRGDRCGEPGEERQGPVQLDPVERRRRLHVPRRLDVDQGPVGAVDGRVGARPHPQPADRPLSRPDDRAVGAAYRSRRPHRRPRRHQPRVACIRRSPAIPASDCDPSYPTLCIPIGSPDLDCGDITERRFPVLPPDPHRFDGNDDDGVGCES